MKRPLLVAVFINLALLSLYAKIHIPSGVYRGDEFSKAVGEAIGQKKPITIVYASEDPGTPECVAATKDALQKLKSETIVVCVFKSDWKSLPRPVQLAIKADDAGGYTPRTVVMDMDAQNVITTIPFEFHQKDRDKLFQDAKKAIKEAMEKKK
jgi:hypothetical protein